MTNARIILIHYSSRISDLLKFRSVLAVLSFEAVVVAKVSHLAVQLSRMHFLPGLESKGFLVSLPAHCALKLELEIIAEGSTNKNSGIKKQIFIFCYAILRQQKKYWISVF